MGADHGRLAQASPGLTSLAKGSLRTRRSVDRWYLLISFSATVPGRLRFGCALALPGALAVRLAT